MAYSSLLLLLLAAWCGTVQAQANTECYSRDGVEYCHGREPTKTRHFPRHVDATTTGTGQTTAVTGCHSHGSDVYCIDGSGHEVSVSLASTPTGELPAKYTGCHSHGSEQYATQSLNSPSLLTAIDNQILHRPGR
jgi:zinc transporter 1/2/3